MAGSPKKYKLKNENLGLFSNGNHNNHKWLSVGKSWTNQNEFIRDVRYLFGTIPKQMTKCSVIVNEKINVERANYPIEQILMKT